MEVFRRITLSCKRIVLVALYFSLSACGGSSSDEETSMVENAIASYSFTTEFLGDQMALNVAQNDNGPDFFAFDELDVMQPDQSWIVEPNNEGTYRIYNQALGTEFSLDSVNDGVFDTLTLAPTANVTGQFWQITALDNGFCRLTNDFTGSDLALDVIPNTPAGPTLTMRTVDNVTGQHWRIENRSTVAGDIDGRCTGG